MKKSFMNMTVRKASNGCGYDYQLPDGKWCVFMTSCLTLSMSDKLDNLFN
jgi:hypothetical protein